MWYVALAVVATLVVALVLANTDLILAKSAPASLEELGAADLQTTSGGGCRAVLSETPAGRARGPSVRCGEGRRRHRGPELQTILQGGDLCGSQGTIVCSLSFLSLPFIFLLFYVFLVFSFLSLNLQQVFYGPKQRRMGLGLGLVRLRVLRNLVHVGRRKGYQGNRKGEGLILGGLFVIGGEQQVIKKSQVSKF
uniref:Uncharacterized protein n=1 Tax=Seriola dumerili TaxID=41447 RepID=A0A3B4UDJ6_SERDU